ncbi:MAG: type IV toxin-antitoxin system AbiEi family antitoxin [Candidatus Paracaedibacteraceae bacterium]|nr:type IV toxin-antitoxin system AbiEi family antitoxin [Candidatus Paracaedibacteraceae bacterium]
MTTLRDYISEIRKDGYRSFTVDKATKDLGINRKAVLLKCMRLIQRGELLSPVKGFYVPIPPEYQEVGSIPPDELIPLVMGYLKYDYYVCLLSAALYHGSSHQKPQVFQIMTNHRGLKIKSGKRTIKVVYKKTLKDLPLSEYISTTGYLKISTPELTMVDLLVYLKPSGGLNSVATIFSELIDAIDVNKLVSLIDLIPQKIWIQRLGYILEQIDDDDNGKKNKELRQKLAQYVSEKKCSYIPLAPELPIKGFRRDKKWKIIINTTIEADE